MVPVKHKEEEQHRSDSYRLKEAVTPANGFGVAPLNVRTAIKAVKDPDRHAKKRFQVRVRLSVLENELARNFIDDAQYEAGKRLESAWDCLSTIKGGSIWRTTGRVDGSRDQGEGHMAAVSQAMDDLKTARITIGETGLQFVKGILEGKPYSSFAERSGGRGTGAVTAVFRWHLRRLAETWAATGPDHARIRSERL